MENKLEILVVEDNREQMGQALQQLASHNITTAENFSDAVNSITSRGGRQINPCGGYDVVLTDMHFGFGNDVCVCDRFCKPDDREDVIKPYGMAVALTTARYGVPRIGIVSAGGDHHSDRNCRAYGDFAFGWSLGPIDLLKIEDSSVVYYDQFKNGHKSWNEVLDMIYRCEAGRDKNDGKPFRKHWKQEEAKIWGDRYYTR